MNKFEVDLNVRLGRNRRHLSPTQIPKARLAQLRLRLDVTPRRDIRISEPIGQSHDNDTDAGQASKTLDVVILSLGHSRRRGRCEAPDRETENCCPSSHYLHTCAGLLPDLDRVEGLKSRRQGDRFPICV
jgi:hypothetical protein